MVYLGGKSKIAKQLAAIINANRRGRIVWDAFCGGMAMSQALGGRLICSDVNVPLISMWRALLDGWEPTYVTREMYESAKHLPDTDPLKAFALFGCSYSGKWCGGYAATVLQNGRFRDYVASSINVVTETANLLKSNVLACQQQSFMDQQVIKTDDLIIYCDPPYNNTTGYSAVGSFDYPRFINTVAAWSDAGVDVFVSEYTFPLGVCVWEQPVTVRTEGGNTGKTAIERLFYVKGKR